jgi:hypothetical protein
MRQFPQPLHGSLECFKLLGQKAMEWTRFGLLEVLVIFTKLVTDLAP